MKKVLTLVIVHDDEKILLGMKKRGFGEGRWNGFGGKVTEGETIEQAAVRELQEEAGIVAKDLTSKGHIIFTFENDGSEMDVSLFSARDFSGEIIETEEMLPQWFMYHEIPYTDMWADDEHWLPHVLVGKSVKGRFHFDNPDNQNILSKTVEVYD